MLYPGVFLKWNEDFFLWKWAGRICFGDFNFILKDTRRTRSPIVNGISRLQNCRLSVWLCLYLCAWGSCKKKVKRKQPHTHWKERMNGFTGSLSVWAIELNVLFYFPFFYLYTTFSTLKRQSRRIITKMRFFPFYTAVTTLCYQFSLFSMS